MIDLFGKGTFLRSWLPLALLAVLVMVLFPPCWPDRRGEPVASWEGLVLLLSVDPPPVEPLRLLVTLPLAASSGAREERLVVGDLRFDAVPLGSDRAGGGSGGALPLLLESPRGELAARLVRRVPASAAHRDGAEVVITLHRAADLAGAGASTVGALLRAGEITAAPGTFPLPAPIVEIPVRIALEPSRHRRWPGGAEDFAEDWQRIRESEPGSLTPFIHARVTLPSRAPIRESGGG